MMRRAKLCAGLLCAALLASSCGGAAGNRLLAGAQDAMEALQSLAKAIANDPVAAMAGAIDNTTARIEQAFGQPLQAVADGLTGGARVAGINLNFTDLQLLAADLGIVQDCTVAEFRNRRKRPIEIIGPTLSLVVNTFNCSVGTFLDDPITLSRGRGDLTGRPVNRLNIPTTAGCDGLFVEYEKSPFIFRAPYEQAERFFCPSCGLIKEFGQAYGAVLYEGGELLQFDNIADFADAFRANKVLPFGNVTWRLASGVVGAVEGALGLGAGAVGVLQDLEAVRKLVTQVGALALNDVKAAAGSVGARLRALLNRTAAGQLQRADAVVRALQRLAPFEELKLQAPRAAARRGIRRAAQRVAGLLARED